MIATDLYHFTVYMEEKQPSILRITSILDDLQAYLCSEVEREGVEE